jgi:SAM-dependent methyltransferase
MALFTAASLERLTGVPVAPAQRAAIFAGLPELRSTPVGAERTAALFAEIEAMMAAGGLRRVGTKEGRDVWEKGWGEVAAQLGAKPVIDVEALKPQYFHPGVPFRLAGEYAHPDTDYFEYYAGLAVRRQLIAHYFEGCVDLLELGCGTGINLLLAADLFSGATFAGADWSRPALEILATLARAKGRPIVPVLYDMLDGSGRDAVPITASTDVLTVHALEQLGPEAPAVIEFLLAKRPRRCLHIEPIIEFYDPADPFDDVARRYHLARGYLRELEPTLRHLAQQGQIEMLGEHRVRLGNTYHEAYSYIAWRPT